MVIEMSRSIARETSESEYSLDRYRVGKTDIVDNEIRCD